MTTAPSDVLAPDLDRLDGVITEVVGADLAVFDGPALLGRVDRLHRAVSRLSAERARIVAELERRCTRPIDDPGPRDRARRRLRNDVAERTNATPSATKLDAQAGQAATCYPSTGAAFAAGEISASHVRLIAETLDAMVDDDQRDAAEQQLLTVARRVNPTVLGRHARELLARQAPLAADAAERRRQESRRVTAYDTPDGGFAFSGLLYGTAAESARVALDAFRTADAPGEHRTPEQRGADAFEQLCTTALRAGTAGTQHGVRPHVIITVTTDQLELGADGIARLGSGQPVLLDDLRHLLADCSWSRVVLAPDGTPLEASESVRTVPSGLWRALLARDGGCTWPGCDAPSSWCDVAHGHTPFERGGRLAPDNATLLCRRHHRHVDRGGYRIVVAGDRVRFEAPDGAAPVARNADAAPDQARRTTPGDGRDRPSEARDGGPAMDRGRPRATRRAVAGTSAPPGGTSSPRTSAPRTGPSRRQRGARAAAWQGSLPAADDDPG
ncbi:MAG: DUF222 domain-containing protein [Nitriliruptoraceae bacterium]